VSGLQVEVRKGSTAKLGRVEGDLGVAKGAKIVAADGKAVTVTGAAHFEGDAEVDCSLQCDSIVVDRGVLKVSGDLAATRGVDVAHTVRVSGAISAEAIEVGGKMDAGSVSCKGSVRVGGIVEVAKALEADSVDVGGKIAVRGAVKLRDLSVGGMAEVGGGSIAGRATIGGIFESKAPLEFGEIRVYGKCGLPAGCKGKRISTGGKLFVGGDLSCEQVEVGGLAEVKGGLSSSKVTVNGKLNVLGSLSFTDALEIFGMGEVRGETKGVDLRVGGRLKTNKAVLSGAAEVAGEVETAVGLKAQSILVGRGSRCTGPLVGGRVELGSSEYVAANWSKSWAGQMASIRLVGRMTSVEDVYADEVVLGANTRCKRVFARNIQLGAGSILEQATYTGELRQGPHRVFITKPPEKVESLPPFPL